MIEVQKLRKKYGKKEILKNLSFSINQGSCVGVIGRNGCGKSTFLSIISGIQPLTQGKIYFQGKDATENKELFSVYTGYVPQENPLIEELTVLDNLKLWYSCSTKDLKESLEHGLPKQLELTSFLKIPVKKLSGGMKKRVSLACALVRMPPILILDEPSVALDFFYKEQLHLFLKQYLLDGGTIIMTSHDQGDLSLCNEYYLLEGGDLKKLEEKEIRKQGFRYENVEK